MIAAVAALTYAATLSLGVVAWRTGRRFGIWHHVMFFLSCATAIAALAYHQQWVLVCPLPILALMPFTRGGSTAHRRLGTLGMAVWLIVGAIMMFDQRILPRL